MKSITTNADPPQQVAASIIDQTFRQAAAQHHAGRLAEAEILYRSVLQVEPGHSDANHNLGLMAMQLGKAELGLPYLQAAWEADPSTGQYWLTLTECLLEMGHAEDALLLIEDAIRRGMDSPQAQQLLMRAKAGNGNKLQPADTVMDETAASRQAAHEQPPASPAALRNGKKAAKTIDAKPNKPAARIEKTPGPQEINALRVLFTEGRFAEAAVLAQAMTERFPLHGFGWKVLGAALKQMGRNADALASMQKAAALSPGDAEAHYNLGNTFKGLRRLDEAEASYRRALKAKPDFAEAYYNLGNTLRDMGRLDEGEDSYRRALQIKPDHEGVFDNLLFTLNYHPDRGGEEIFEAYREYDAKIGLPHRSAWRPHGNNGQTGRRLKVGYVSPDFKKHPVRYFLEPLLARHDKKAVEIYVYAELTGEDEVTARYKGYADHWLLTTGMGDAALAERIRADGIDILVDLAGHTDRNRLGVFTRKPAPVSLSWLGYGYTTGLTAIDYLLTDDVCAPPGCENVFSEKPWRLATPGYVYRPAEGMGEVNPLPAIGAGYITFGTLSRGIRINHHVIRVWSEVLKRVEKARLVIDSKDFIEASAQDALAGKFAAHGIGRHRLQIGCHSPPWNTMRGIDIGLDCFPHNSGTTLFESLYMGIPYITLAGRPGVGKIGSSVLEGIGHPEWIARTENEYIEKAAALAGDLQKLSALRAGLRQEMQAGPLMDEHAFARKVETAYREMFEKWARG